MSCSHISTQCYCRARLQVQTRLCKSYPSTISDSLDIFIEGFCYTILMLTLTTNRTKKTFSAYVINVFLHNWRSSGPASVFFSWPKLLQGYNQHSPKKPILSAVLEGRLLSLVRTMVLWVSRTKATLCILIVSLQH